jgi:hypothetical protein
MAKEKKILITIPAEFNSRLNLYLLRIRDLGVEITKAQLLINLADLGLKVEQKEIEIKKE